MEYKTIHGVDLAVKDDMVVLSDNRNGGFEESTFKFLNQLIDALSGYHDRPLVFADIGAYTGLYSIYTAKRGCLVEAFEPNPKVYKRLRANIIHNDTKVGGWSGKIHTYTYAVADSYTEACFYTNPNTLLTSGGSLSVAGQLTTNSVVNKVETIPYSLRFFQRPDIVKIDVEGHELSVLRGMEWLSDPDIQKPYVIVEANDSHHYTEIYEYLVNEIGGFEFMEMVDTRNMILAPKTQK